MIYQNGSVLQICTESWAEELYQQEQQRKAEKETKQ